ncbi:hypothetical protein WMY93_030351 [Mugilogobius chulae]|uniref:Uncharacterized protein n=1 Tax=Mugilogobius chulae TaxID=88201 RepID=A0AAW0MGX7_9GOBI
MHSRNMAKRKSCDLRAATDISALSVTTSTLLPVVQTLVPQTCPRHDPTQEISSACWVKKSPLPAVPRAGHRQKEKGDPSLAAHPAALRLSTASTSPCSTSSAGRPTAGFVTPSYTLHPLPNTTS